MSGTEVGYLLAFAAGLLSFLSPCVLPMIPTYLSFISGIGVEELKEGQLDRQARITLLLNAISFILGFSLVFLILGAMASSVGMALRTIGLSIYRAVEGNGWRVLFVVRDVPDEIAMNYELAFRVGLIQIGGILVILLGLHVLGIWKIPFLYREKRVEVQKRPVGYLTSMFIGAAFSLGWTPCVGPILGAIFLLAAQMATPWKGMTLLAAYSMGLAVPFLLSALLVTRLFRVIRRGGKFYRAIKTASGVLLLFIGVVLFLDQLTWLNNLFLWVTRFVDITVIEEKLISGGL